MKRKSFLLSGLAGLALAALTATPALAQSTARPPTQLTYQGFLTDANGLPFGSTSPVNKTVVFRIYDALTAGNLKWSSQQVITVDKGYFSALLGQGSPVGGDPSTAFNADLTGVFVGSNTASDRYLEITADGVTIAPRLRFLPAPYAMLAKSATELLDPITGSSSLSISGGNVSSAGNFAINNVTATGALNAGSVSGGSVSSSGLVSGQTLMSYANVTTHGQGAYLEWNKDSGGGMSYLLNQKGGGGGGIVFGEVSTANVVSERMRIDGGGNLAIGTVSAVGKVTISEGSGTVAGGNNGTLVIDHENAGGASSILFRSKVNRGSDFGYIQFQDDATIGGNGEVSVLTIGIQNDGNDHIALLPSGNVGIGTTNPSQRLEVAGSGLFYGSTGIGYVNQGFYGDGGNIALRAPVNGSTFFQTYGGGRTDMFIASNGKVGIGTTGPVVQLDVRSSTFRSQTDFKNGGTDSGDYAYKDMGQHDGTPSSGLYVSIRSEGYTEALGAVYYSDRRIKEIDSLVESEAALKQINRLKVTDYRMVDKVQRGHELHRGLIAQEVKEVIPGAVMQRQDFVPTIYANATAVAYNKTNHTVEVTVPKAHDLKKGDLVRLYDDKGAKDLKVLNVAGATKFEVAVTNQISSAFVYGKQVNDFLSVDYDRVFTTSLAAVQELSKLVNTQAEALRRSETRVAELEQKASRVATLETEMAEMKKALARLMPGQPDARPAAQKVSVDGKVVAAR